MVPDQVMKALFGYSFDPVTWAEEIKQRFYSTYSTPFSNRKALWCIACVDRVDYVGLDCNFYPPHGSHTFSQNSQYIWLEIFWEFLIAPVMKPSASYLGYRLLTPEWQPVEN